MAMVLVLSIALSTCSSRTKDYSTNADMKIMELLDVDRNGTRPVAS